jgi:hypothetical protein
MPAMGSIKLGEPDQTMDTFLSPEVTVGIRSLNGNGHTLYASFFTFANIEDF